MRLFPGFFRNVICKAVFVLGVIYVVFTVVKMLLGFDGYDILILFFSLSMIGGSIHFQKKETDKENRLRIKKEAAEIKEKRDREELLKRKAEDAEIDKASERYDKVDFEKNLKEVEFGEEDEFDAMFGFFSVKLKNVFYCFMNGNPYDKIMCGVIFLAVFLLFEPYTVYSSEAFFLAFFIVPYLLLAIVWCGGEFWLVPGALILIIKFMFVQPELVVLTVAVIFIAVCMVLVRKRLLSTAPPKSADDEKGFVKVNAEIPKLSDGEILLSRYHTEAYDDLTMIYSEATAQETAASGLDTLLTEDGGEKLLNEYVNYYAGLKAGEDDDFTLSWDDFSEERGEDLQQK